jgi:transcriptional regulator
MYVPAHFEESRLRLSIVMTAYPFGTLVTHGRNGLDANHIPFHLDPSQGPIEC